MMQTFLLRAAEGNLIWRIGMLNFESLMKLALTNNIFAFEKFTPLLEGKTMNRSGGNKVIFSQKEQWQLLSPTSGW